MHGKKKNKNKNETITDIDTSSVNKVALERDEN